MYKAVFVDFDNTLVLHIDPKVTKYLKKSERALCMFKPKKEAVKMYEHSCINTDVVDYIKNSIESDGKVILLSESTSKLMEVKRYYLQKHLPNFVDEYISTSLKDIPKSLVIEAYIRQFNIPRNRVLYIEDDVGSIDMIRKQGLKIDVMQPQVISYASHIEPLNTL